MELTKFIRPDWVRRRDGVTPPFGLSFVPTLEPKVPDSQDWVDGHLDWRGPGDHDNTDAVLALVEAEATGRRNVMEIGVAFYDPSRTMTHRVFRARHPDGVYLGVDIEDRSAVVRGVPNAHTLRISSLQQDVVRGHLAGLGVEQLDLLIIDGNHSVQFCLNDWRYADLVAPGGVVLMHDTNTHPGPAALVEAIDRDLFEVREPLLGVKDYGLTICRRK